MSKHFSTLSAGASALAFPAFWPLVAAAAAFDRGAAFYARNLKFVEEEARLLNVPEPVLATPNTVRLDLRTMTLRDYGTPGKGIPTLVDAPYAGHSAAIADYRKDQSLVQTLLDNGVDHVALTDWKSATYDMRDLEIDDYLADLVVAIDDLGGKANLVGLCQGGWMCAMVAARFPEKVNSLVLAGSPIDAHAGNGPLKRLVEKLPMKFYEELVAMGGGRMKGDFMLQGWKNMHPDQHYLQSHLDLYFNIDDDEYLDKTQTFRAWYENAIDLPGRWYLQAIRQIFKENRLANGEFVALGRTLDLKTITCPVFLLGGEHDDITPPEQVLGAKDYLGTPKDKIVERIVPGGHIGLFMGSRTLKTEWTEIGRWLAAQG